MKILAIEDQEIIWEGYVVILTQICKIAETDIDRARWYTEAEEKIKSKKQYDLILLDHRMPEHDPGCTDIDNSNRFRTYLKDIGYGLLPLIQQRQLNAVVIGTSSFSQYDIPGYQIPERRLDKTDMFDKLPKIINSLIRSE